MIYIKNRRGPRTDPCGTPWGLPVSQILEWKHIQYGLSTFENISFSNILFRLESRDIGLELLTSSLEPFLNIGMVFAILRRSGWSPVEN